MNVTLRTYVYEEWNHYPFLCSSLCRRKYNTGSFVSANLSYIRLQFCFDPCVVPTCIVVLDLGYIALVSVILFVERVLYKMFPSSPFSVSFTCF